MKFPTMKFPTMIRVLTALLAIVICSSYAGIAAADVQKTFHVSPAGSDDNPGTEAKPFKTVRRARDEVRKVNQNMTGDIEVVLHDGTYRLSHDTLFFDHNDNGTGGHNVIYRAAIGATPVISGGEVITGWQEDAEGRWKADCDGHFRQLYVNGRRAVRARSPVIRTEDRKKWFDLGFAELSGMELFGENGYRTTDVAMADWRNPGEIEFCYYVGWCHTRCKVESIARDGAHAIVRMVQPHFMLARCKEGLLAEMPHYMENALELLDEPGEWYLDRSDKVLYYKPRPGEKMNEVQVVAPVLETLVELRGLLDHPVEHIQFQGITFAHATWLRPSRIGLADVQANFVQHTLNRIDRLGRVNNVHNEDLKSPANIICRVAKNIRFDRCTFEHLGGAGLDLEYGSSDNVVEGCHFHDISGSAIQVGGVERSDHHPDDKRTTVSNNQILNNLIENCAVEYAGGLGVFVGYTDATVIAHNEIRDLPYSGISMGWGWGEEDAGGGRTSYYQPYLFDTPSAARNNRIEYNHIHRIMQLMKDGAGIYMLGNMPGTIIQKNHIHNNANIFGGIYPDEGSGFIEITGNVVYYVKEVMHYNNKPQNRKDTCNDHDNWFGNEYAKDAENLPEGAKKVIEKAGLQPQYQDLLKK